MQTRLDSELVRAASSEQDLTLMVIRIANIDWTTEVAKQISSHIIETVKFADFVFNYKEDGCTAIFQGMDLNQALEEAENLHTDIIAMLAKYGMYNTVNIGLSARSLRLISASRLANEAEQALSHAVSDRESPIVAFKVNPEKYRTFLASENAE